MKIAEVVKTLRKSKKMTQVELAGRLNLSQTNIMFIENGIRTPSKETAKRMAKFFSVPIQTFLEDDFDINIEAVENNILVPYYNIHASAGEGLYFDSAFISQYMKISDGEFKHYLRGVKEPALISIKGISMEPTLKDRDMILVDANDHELHDGEIYVICINEQIYVKRLFRNPTKKKITIKSDNPLYPAYDVSPNEIQINAHLIMRMFEVLK